MKKTHILVAEDDEHIRNGLTDALESEGYSVTAVANGRRALDAFHRQSYDLVLLDIMMPEVSGFDVCKAIRQSSHTPIVMLTAKGEEIDKVIGLEFGADDYITKPFGLRELLARIAAVLRRSRLSAAPEQEAPLPDELPFGAALINRKTYAGRLGRRSFNLSARELKLIETFHRHPGEVLSRNDLLNAAWGIDYLGTTRTLDQHIVQLRKKIEPEPDQPAVILTVHGIGYRYAGAKQSFQKES